MRNWKRNLLIVGAVLLVTAGFINLVYVSDPYFYQKTLNMYIFHLKKYVGAVKNQQYIEQNYSTNRVETGIKISSNIQLAVFQNLDVYRNFLKTAIVIEDTNITKTDEQNVNDIEEFNAKFYGVIYKGKLVKSAPDSTCLISYFQGHRGNPFDKYYFKEILKRLKRLNCDLLAFSMLGRSFNVVAMHYPIKNLSNSSITAEQSEHHSVYATFHDAENPHLDPLSLFLNGPYHIIEYLAPNYSTIIALGVSGGGWSVNLIAAMMPEITGSISVAGSVPMMMRDYHRNKGDWEQTESEIYRSIDYWHLYFLSMYGKTNREIRPTHLIYNRYDRCCFASPFADELKAILAGENRITVSVIDHDEHAIDVDMVENMIANIIQQNTNSEN
jgi:hypothetical protein